MSSGCPGRALFFRESTLGLVERGAHHGVRPGPRALGRRAPDRGSGAHRPGEQVRPPPHLGGGGSGRGSPSHRAGPLDRRARAREERRPLTADRAERRSRAPSRLENR